MASAVLDASAVLALLRQEPGSERVAEVIPEALISTVNVCEVIAKLVERGATPGQAEEIVKSLPCEPVDFTLVHAFQAGVMRAETKSAGLSLGDRACLSLAMQEKLPAITADRRWLETNLSVDIQTIR